MPHALLLVWLLVLGLGVNFETVYSAVYTATTTINLSICGNALVDPGEECDVPGETGQYSTTIAGRQCSTSCLFGPYCGDGILQVQFGEQCDDGNNEDADFCSSACTIEPAGSGGGGSSGGGGGGGGRTEELGDTSISITGFGYPGQTINFLLDTQSIGTIRAGSTGRFEFSAPAAPGTATLGVWSTDTSNRRSITLNNTFDVTQGAVTNVSGVIIPPTIGIANPRINPGDTITLSGQAVPNATVEIHFNNSELVRTATSGPSGVYSLNFNTSQLRIAEYTVRARSVTGRAPLFTQSIFSTSLQLFVGVDGSPTTPSDLNRDGRIDLIDFSILIFWWNSPGGDSDPPADINGNGRVGLEDFSILLFNWTG